jgi:hypothetical protein
LKPKELSDSASNQTNQPRKKGNQKGGKRPGAGRKPSTLKAVLAKCGKLDAEALFLRIKGKEKWEALVNSKDENIRLRALIYLTDRAYGKVAQPLEHSGEVTVNLAESIAKARKRVGS